MVIILDKITGNRPLAMRNDAQIAFHDAQIALSHVQTPPRSTQNLVQISKFIFEIFIQTYRHTYIEPTPLRQPTSLRSCVQSNDFFVIFDIILVI